MTSSGSSSTTVMSTFFSATSHRVSSTESSKMSDLLGMSDEIESVLFVGREVMGESNELHGGHIDLTFCHSLSRPATDIH